MSYSLEIAAEDAAYRYTDDSVQDAVYVPVRRYLSFQTEAEVYDSHPEGGDVPDALSDAEEWAFSALEEAL